METLAEARSFLEQQQYDSAALRYLDVYKYGPFELQPMAGLYRGICLYYQGQYAEAAEHLARVDSCFVDFPLREELHYWQGRSAMQRGDIDRMLKCFDLLENKRYQVMADSCIFALAQEMSPKEVNLRFLAAFYERAASRTIKEKLQEALLRYVPLGQEAMIDTLFETNRGRKYGRQLLDEARLTQKTFHVAVLLPFLAEVQISSDPQSMSSFVWDLYRGISSAQAALLAKGIRLQLHPYDTRRSLPETLTILDSLAKQKLHLIIGPLYLETIAPVQAFALRNEIPMLNPLSSNPILSTTFEAWLLRAHDLTQMTATSTYVDQHFTNRTAAIFCEDETRLRTSCEAYARALRTAGFELRFERYLSPKRSIELRDQLCHVERSLVEGLDTDSIPQPEEGYAFRKGIGRYAEQEEQWYKERWAIRPNEIGHIMVLARHPSFLSYALSAVEQRPDTIPIITQTHWLDVPESDYDQFERLGVQFIDPAYIPFEGSLRQRFLSKFFNYWGDLPSRHAFLGYELCWIMGQAMYQYGDNFMYMLQQSGDPRVGQLGLGLRYLRGKKDNQWVSFLRIQDAQIEVLYTYGKEEKNASE